MKRLYTTVGDYSVEIYCEREREWLLSWLLNNLQTVQADKLHSTYLHSFVPDLKLYLEQGYGVPFAGDKVLVYKHENETVYQRSDYQVTIAAGHQQARIAVYDGVGLKHALLNVISAIVVFHRWGLLLCGEVSITRGQAQLHINSHGEALVKISDKAAAVYESPFKKDWTAPEIVPYYPLYAVCGPDSIDRPTSILTKKAALQELTRASLFLGNDDLEAAKRDQLCWNMSTMVPFFSNKSHTRSERIIG
jgi:hypothetical protein